MLRNIDIQSIQTEAYPRNKTVWIWSRCKINGHDIGSVAVEALKELA